MSELKISVLMSVHNGEKYLHKAIDSILNQTFKNFEFIILDDASTDNSLNIIQTYQDSRIRLIKNEQNLGLTKSLNKGLDLCEGKYIVRMDADDVSLPNRIQSQVDYMEKNQDIGVCGSWAKFIGEREGIICKMPINYDEIKCRLMFENVIIHPSVIIHKEMFEKFSLKYDENLQFAQDYELWCRAIDCFKFANIPEVLLLYRIHQGQIWTKNRKPQDSVAIEVSMKMLKKLSINIDKEELQYLINILHKNLHISLKEIKDIETFLIKIKKANDENCYLNKEALNRELNVRFYSICYHAKAPIADVASIFYKSAINKEQNFKFIKTLSLLARRWFRV